ncbi:aquaporin [Microbacterium sp. USHLN186]|uniref:aquaporin n=1 Tax=Microbacterium sp. USHLN186 TaxID=3081286 RepID=UPI0030183472
MNSIRLPRRAAAEFLGTALLACIVIGSGVTAERLSDDHGIQLFTNTVACVLGLGLLIVVLGPVSGGHLNPLLSLADRMLGRSERSGLTRSDVAVYLLAQLLGAFSGMLLAAVMFQLPVAVSGADRVAPHTFVGELVAAAGLVFVFSSLARARQSLPVVAVTMAAYLGAASWFTSSFGFLNPAITLARVFTDTYAGIAPASALLFIVAQLIGGAFGAVAAAALFPGEPTARRDEADEVMAIGIAA